MACVAALCLAGVVLLVIATRRVNVFVSNAAPHPEQDSGGRSVCFFDYDSVSYFRQNATRRDEYACAIG